MRADSGSGEGAPDAIASKGAAPLYFALPRLLPNHAHSSFQFKSIVRLASTGSPCLFTAGFKGHDAMSSIAA